jgi:hypothetical protein
MKTYVYKPVQCSDQTGQDGEITPATFSGEVVLKVPAYEQKLEMLVAHPEMMDEDLGKKKKGSSKVSLSEMRTVLAMVKWSYEFYQKVDLVRLSDKKKITSLDDLRYDAGCQGIIQDVAARLSQGFELGN